MATSVGGVLTGRGADFIIIDAPLKPEEALSETQRKSVNQWFDNTSLSRLNHKEQGVIILVMQRLHQDDLVGHVLGSEEALPKPSAFPSTNPLIRNSALSGPKMFRSEEALGLPATKQTIPAPQTLRLERR
jgi:hypothetical protein